MISWRSAGSRRFFLGSGVSISGLAAGFSREVFRLSSFDFDSITGSVTEILGSGSVTCPVIDTDSSLFPGNSFSVQDQCFYR
jgi:hypothetical protein